MSYSEAIVLNNEKYSSYFNKYKIDTEAHTSHTSSHSHVEHTPVPLPATGFSLVLLFAYLFYKRK